jgi:hypothetical protein
LELKAGEEIDIVAGISRLFDSDGFVLGGPWMVCGLLGFMTG